MAVKSDLRSHSRVLEDLLKRVTVLEKTGGGGGADSSSVDDLFIRVTQLEEALSDETTMGPKKLAIKFGAKMDELDARLQTIEAGDEAEAEESDGGQNDDAVG